MNTALKKVLFIAWDAPHVNFLEGLFGPVYIGMQQSGEYEFHIIHFSWLSEDKLEHLKAFCSRNKMHYTYVRVNTSIPVAGKILTTMRGNRVIREYVRAHKIDILMPRSTMPAKMVLSSIRSFDGIRIVFDADGLPIEERVEYAGLKEGSLRYRMLKRIEHRMLLRADRVLTRSRAAIEVLTQTHNLDSSSKFFVVLNGRDEHLFTPAVAGQKKESRDKLGIPSNAFVMVYTGSLGPQYGITEMFFLQKELLKKRKDSYLVLVTTNPDYLEKNGIEIPPNTIVRTAPFGEVANYLRAGDIGLAIRQPTFSMKGVSPVKLGEYLLSGLPVVASPAIGDTETLLKDQLCAFLLADHQQQSLDAALNWIHIVQSGDVQEYASAARLLGLAHFSLASAIKSYKHALSF